jgi:hypothetical protein
LGIRFYTFAVNNKSKVICFFIEESAFLHLHLKAMLTKPIKNLLNVPVPLLVYPDPNKTYVFYTDASDTCIGACLTQEVQ